MAIQPVPGMTPVPAFPALSERAAGTYNATATVGLLAPASWHGQLLAFALFRLFDAAKPHPVRWADQCFKGSGWRGGWGILFDDLVAAFCTLLVLAAGRHFGLW